MSSNSATALATQQSIKAYVDSQVATADTLSEVLGNGNTTGGTDIAVGTGDDITFADSSKAIFGAGSDLQIYHDGSHSYISDQGTGHLKLLVRDFRINNDSDTKQIMKTVVDGQVELYHNNSKKFETTSTGIDVTGTVTADGATIEGNASVFTLKNTDTGVTTDQVLSRIDFEQTDVGDPGVTARISHVSNGNNGAGMLEFFTGSTVATLRERLKIADGGDISFYEDTGTTAKLFWDASAESLGIGTSSPDTPLHISTNVQAVAQLESSHANGSYAIWAVGGTKFGDVGSNKGISGSGNTTDFMIASRSTYPLLLGTGSTERLRIDSSGNVGIGNDAPTTLLHVGDGSSGAENIARIEGRTTVGGQEVGSLQFYQVTNAPDEFIGAEVQLQSGSGRSNSALVFNVSQASNTDASEAMRIDSSGNVGIGKSDPSFPLDISGERARISGGTTTSFGGLEAENDSGNGTIFGTGGSGRTDLLDNRGFISAQTATAGLAIGTEGADPVLFYTNGTTSERMRIDSSGNVGIGTNSPTNVVGYTTTNIGAGSVGSILKMDGVTSGFYHRLINNNGDLGIQADQGNAKASTNITFSVDSTEAMRIDSSGNLLVGKTGTSFSTAGSRLTPDGGGQFIVNEAACIEVNRLSNDGTLVGLYKDGTTVGSIRSQSGLVTDIILDPRLNNYATGHGIGGTQVSGVPKIIPRDGSGNALDAGIDLGHSNNRFKDLYLSSGIHANNAFQRWKVVDNNGGSGIFSTITNGEPQTGFLYAYETGTSKYIIAALFKEDESSVVTTTQIANNGLTVNATNSGGTIALAGATTASNVRMQAVTIKRS
jgi:hypothetical protein